MLPNNNMEMAPEEEQASPDISPADVNLEELARKVFELLLREIQMENDRTGKY